LEYDLNSTNHTTQSTFCHTKNIFFSSEAKQDGMKQHHMGIGDLTKQQKRLESYYTT
jgi:hypothetical protein